MAENTNDDLKIIESVNDTIRIELEPEGGDTSSKVEHGAERVAQPDEGVEALKRQLAAEKQQRAEEARQRQEAEDRARRAEEQTLEGQSRLISNSMEAATSRRDQAKRDLAAAAQGGEWERFADAQAALNEAQIQLDRLSEGKRQIDARAAQEKERPQQERRTYSDPVEALIHETKLPAKSATWLRAHPDCVTDDAMNADMIAAHKNAVKAGLEIESPEYFAFIEKRLGFGNDDTRADEGQQREAPKREARTPAAPPSRGAVPGRGSDSNIVTLSPAEKAYCDETGTSYKDYAKSKQALIKEGRLH